MNDISYWKKAKEENDVKSCLPVGKCVQQQMSKVTEVCFVTLLLLNWPWSTTFLETRRRAKLVNFLINFSVFQIHFVICYESYHNELDDFIKGFSKLFTSEKILNFFWTIDITTLKSLIEEQTGINEQGWKKVPPCLLIY